MAIDRLAITRTTERAILKSLIEELISHGLTITVDYGEDDYPINKSADSEAILAQMWACDEERLIVHQDSKRMGSILLIYNNGDDGWTVVADYSVNLEPYFKNTWAEVLNRP
jgi:hypothetical protein